MTTCVDSPRQGGLPLSWRDSDPAPDATPATISVGIRPVAFLRNSECAGDPAVKILATDALTGARLAPGRGDLACGESRGVKSLVFTPPRPGRDHSSLPQWMAGNRGGWGVAFHKLVWYNGHYTTNHAIPLYGGE